MAEPTPPAPTTRQSAPAKSKPLALAARVNPTPSNMSPWSEPALWRRIALHAPRLLWRVHRLGTNADPLGRVLRTDRRRHDLHQQRPQQPGPALCHGRGRLRVGPPGLQCYRAPLRIGDAARPPLRIAGMSLG